MLSSLFARKPVSHAVRLAPSGETFTAAPKETLLQAALMATPMTKWSTSFTARFMMST